MSADPGQNSRALPGLGGSETRPHTAGLQSTCQTDLERVRARLSPALAAALPGLLAEAPDPDGALLLFERLCESAETVRLLEQHNFLAHYAIVVFGHSRFLGETLVQNADLLAVLSAGKKS